MVFLFLSAAKKTKKKGKTLTLTDFLAEDSSGSGTTVYPPAKATSWADETEDLEGEGEQELKQGLNVFTTSAEVLTRRVWL